jgi:hypothetical protein
MKKWLTILMFAPLAMLVGNFGLALYAVPAIFSLSKGIRPGLEPLTLTQAVRQLRVTGKSGWELVEAARALVEERLQYSRRSSFNSDVKAFERGYGFCTQQAYVLVDLLKRLGFEAKAVQAFRNEFPNGRRGGHTWVSVSWNGESRWIDSIFYDAESKEITFVPISNVHNHTTLFKILTRAGEAALNAHRYYRTGKDM